MTGKRGATGPDTPVPARIDSFTGPYRFLSNFYRSPIMCPIPPDYTEHHLAETVENAYQACKCQHPEDAKAIIWARSPGEAKRMGRRVELLVDWDRRRIPLMRILLAIKFRAGIDLAGLLLATGDAELVEGNTWGDQFWGVCNGVGENHLGRLLMDQRDLLQLGGRS